MFNFKTRLPEGNRPNSRTKDEEEDERTPPELRTQLRERRIT
jgi:hypothetical protein